MARTKIVPLNLNTGTNPVYQPIQCEVVRSKRKTLALYIKLQKLVVRCPRAASNAEVDEFIENNQDATLDIVMKYAENENRDHMRFMLETELSDSMSAATMAGGIGAMNSSRWNELRDVLLKFGAIEKSVNIEDAVDDSLRSSLFKDGKLK